MAEQQTAHRGSTRTEVGVVLSNKMQKTVVVGVERVIRHPIYEKYLRKQVRYKAHDEKNECGIGDRVEICETRPLSREKRWRVQRIVERAKV
ncbi:MAG: 30S ribosomal protein S17 [Bdellovibrionota bacterium]